MQKTVLTKAVAVALATFGAGAAFAQSSLTLYGNIDAALDNVHKGAGKTTNGAAAVGTTVTRVSPSISSQSALGLKGTEDIGGGYKAGFVLEGQFGADIGAQNGQDSRMWGRQAFVGLTTPFGELRLGRQYAPIFYSFVSSSVESIGAADLMASGLVVNNLQVRQDNQISYWLRAGDLTAAASYSPNAGVPTKISPLRSTNGGGTSTSQIVGGASAGDESTTSRGKTAGLFLNYAVDTSLTVTGGYHYNKFGEAAIVNATNPNQVWYSLDKYTGFVLGAKYTLPSSGTVFGANLHEGKFTNDEGSPEGAKVQTVSLGFKHPIDQFAVGAEMVYSKFSNFTKGKDKGLMLAGDYNLSKRTRLYTRIGVIKDTAGNATVTQAGNSLIGGPLPMLVSLGSTETPFFAGGSANVDATTRVVSIGIRHQF